MATSTSSNIQGSYDVQESKSERTATPASQAAQAAYMQTLREGTPLAVQEVMTDYEAAGDIVPDTEGDDEDISKSKNEDTMDGEIDMRDVDEPAPEGQDDNPSFQPDVAVSPSGRENLNDEIEQDAAFELIVRDGVCRFERPKWMRWRSTNKRGRAALDELERRFLVLERITQWLNTYRSLFLKNPDPWLLGCNALAELREGLASVSPEDFLDIATIRSLGGDSLFSRNRRATVLSWVDGTLSLDFLFGRDARMAWVANAVLQFAGDQGFQITDAVLSRRKKITVPKNKKAKNQLLAEDADSLDFGSLIARANLMADTKWRMSCWYTGPAFSEEHNG